MRKALLAAAALSTGFVCAEPVTLLAHRGMAQSYDHHGMERDTCTATRMDPPVHDYLENTIDSMRAAFDRGADIVEFDIHPTTDGEFVVFHDWTVECRTNGHGVTREQSLAYLKSLDIGHGYTADGGATFPFRGKFFGAMPTWAEVMAAFPGKRFVVNIKSNDPREARKVIDYAGKHGFALERLAFSGGDRPIAEIRTAWPTVRTLSRGQLKSCVLGYFFTGWTGHIPRACHNALIYVPENYTWLFWGWPNRYVERMAKVNSQAFLIGPLGSGEYGMTALDSPEAIARLPKDYRAGIVTDRIDIVGPILRPSPARTPSAPAEARSPQGT